MDGWQAELHRATQDLWSQIPGWHTSLDPYAPDSAWVWEYITQTEPQSDNRQAVWWSDMVVALVIKAALANVPSDPVIRMPALQAVQGMRAIAGEGTLDLVLLNAEHGVMLLADNVLQQPLIQAQCRHFQVIIVVSRGEHFVTYFRKNRILVGPPEREGLLRLRELKAKRPLVEPIRHEEPRRTTRSANQPEQHLVVYTNTKVVNGVEYFAPSRWCAHLCRLKSFKKWRGPSAVSLPCRGLHIMVNSMNQAEQPLGSGRGSMRSIGGRGRRCIGGPSEAKEEVWIKKPKGFIGGVYSLW